MEDTSKAPVDDSSIPEEAQNYTTLAQGGDSAPPLPPPPPPPAQAQEEVPEAEVAVTAQEAGADLDAEIPEDATSLEELKRPRTARDRIAELTRKLKAKEEELQGLKKPETEAKPSDSTDALKEPNPDDFPEGYLDEGFVNAQAKYVLEKQSRELEHIKQEARDAVRAEFQLKEYQERWQRHHTKGQSLYADYQQTVDNAVKSNTLFCSETAAELLTQSEYAPQLVYHLAKNPDKALEISQLPDHLQSYELGKLEAGYATSTKQSPSTVTHTRAKPIPELRAVSSGADTDMSPEDAPDYATFERLVNRRLSSQSS